jgi:hypothetical protein
VQEKCGVLEDQQHGRGQHIEEVGYDEVHQNTMQGVMRFRDRVRPADIILS